jgi:hypothetical protein
MNASAFLAGILHGLLGGLLGLGGAAWRVPHPHGVDPLRSATSVVVIVAAWLCRAKIVPLAELATHLDVVASLLAGGLAGAWWMTQQRRDWRAIAVILVGLAVATLTMPALAGGMLAGVAIGIVMRYHVAGGLLLVPAIVLLYGLDIKVAGSLALMAGLPLLLVGLLRGHGAATLAVLRQEQRQFIGLACGGALGAALGALLLGLLPSTTLMTLLEGLLVYAAILNFVIFPQNFRKRPG